MRDACKFLDDNIQEKYDIRDDEPEKTRTIWKMKFVECWKLYRDKYYPHITNDTTVDSNSAINYYLDRKTTTSKRLASSNRRRDPQSRKSQQIPAEVEKFFNRTTALDMDQDPLEWWKANEKSYPVCAAMARDILAIPSSSAEPERVHSQARTVLNWNQSRMGHYSVEASVTVKCALLYNKAFGQLHDDQFRKLDVTAYDLSG